MTEPPRAVRRLEPDQVVAERDLVFEPLECGQPPVTVRFRLGRPTRSGVEWFCPFEVIGLGDTRVEAAYGADSVQALLLALAKLRVVLGALALEHRGRLEFAGRVGPGIPSLFEEAPVDDAR